MASPFSERLVAFGDKRPVLGNFAYVAPGAWLAGEVTLGECANVWFNSILRGDINRVTVGPWTNIQDNSVCHVTDELPCIIGAYCTVGHRAIIHACTVGDETLVGMGAVVMDECVIGNQCIIGASALVTKGLKVPDGSLVYGSPAKVVSHLGEKERHDLRKLAEKYVKVAATYRDKDPAAR